MHAHHHAVHQDVLPQATILTPAWHVGQDADMADSAAASLAVDANSVAESQAPSQQPLHPVAVDALRLTQHRPERESTFAGACVFVCVAVCCGCVRVHVGVNEA